jgi:hypothetical protein
MRERRNASTILVRTPEGKRTIGRNALKYILKKQGVRTCGRD